MDPRWGPQSRTFPQTGAGQETPFRPGASDHLEATILLLEGKEKERARRVEGGRHRAESPDRNRPGAHNEEAPLPAQEVGLIF